MKILRKMLFVFIVFLNGCAVDKCNDYVVAYDCTSKYGTECREHYLEICEECERNNQ